MVTNETCGTDRTAVAGPFSQSDFPPLPSKLTRSLETAIEEQDHHLQEPAGMDDPSDCDDDDLYSSDSDSEFGDYLIAADGIANPHNEACCSLNCQSETNNLLFSRCQQSTAIRITSDSCAVQTSPAAVASITSPPTNTIEIGDSLGAKMDALSLESEMHTESALLANDTDPRADYTTASFCTINNHPFISCPSTPPPLHSSSSCMSATSSIVSTCSSVTPVAAMNVRRANDVNKYSNSKRPFGTGYHQRSHTHDFNDTRSITTLANEDRSSWNWVRYITIDRVLFLRHLPTVNFHNSIYYRKVLETLLSLAELDDTANLTPSAQNNPSMRTGDKIKFLHLIHRNHLAKIAPTMRITVGQQPAFLILNDHVNVESAMQILQSYFVEYYSSNSSLLSKVGLLPSYPTTESKDIQWTVKASEIDFTLTQIQSLVRPGQFSYGNYPRDKPSSPAWATHHPQIARTRDSKLARERSRYHYSRSKTFTQADLASNFANQSEWPALS